MGEISAVKELEQKYQGEWVVVEVTQTDRNGFAKKGRVLAHHADKRRVIEAHLAFIASHPGAKTYQFFVGPVIPEGVTVVL